MIDHRQHPRTPFKASVKVTHASLGEQILTLRDLSHGGVFLLTPSEFPLEKGETVQLQVQGMSTEAPVLDAEIIRKNDEGIALKFSNQSGG